MRRLALIAALFTVPASAAAGSALPERGGDEQPAPKVEVLDRGDKPREKLRLDVEEGHEAALSLTLEFGLDQVIDGESQPSPELPAIRQDMLLRVADVADGKIASQFDIEAIEIVDPEDADPAVVDELEEQLDTLVGLAGRDIRNTRGVVLETALDIPEGLDPTLEMVIDQLSQQFAQFSTPFPRESVGTGARWTVTVSLEVLGITTDTVYDVELVERDDSRLVLDVSYEQTAEPQEVDLPGVPAVTDVQLVEFAISGSGTITLDLESISPGAGSLEASGDQVLAIEGGGEELQLEQTVRLRATVERTE